LIEILIVVSFNLISIQNSTGQRTLELFFHFRIYCPAVDAMPVGLLKNYQQMRAIE
jgi:hypothetical protein